MLEHHSHGPTTDLLDPTAKCHVPIVTGQQTEKEMD